MSEEEREWRYGGERERERERGRESVMVETGLTEGKIKYNKGSGLMGGQASLPLVCHTPTSFPGPSPS